LELLHHDRVVQRDLLTVVTRVEFVILSAIFGSSEGDRTWWRNGCSGVVGSGSRCAWNGGGCVLRTRRSDTDVGIGDEVRTVHVECWVVAAQLGESDAMRGSYSRTIIPWLDKVRRARSGQTTVKLNQNLCGSRKSPEGRERTDLDQRID